MNRTCDCKARFSTGLNLIPHESHCAGYRKKASVSAILDQRQEDYGDAKDNFTAIGRMWGAGLQIEDIPAFQVALQMAQLKIQRIIANPYKKDSWDDLLGYLHHAQNLLPERDGE